MEAHLVDTVAIVVMGVEHRLVFVGLKAQLDQLTAAGQRAKGLQLRLGPGRTFPFHGFPQGHILLVQVVVGSVY